MSEIDRRLKRIESERAIERLIYGYGRILDFGDPDEYVAQFTEHAVLEIQGAFRNLFNVGTQPYESEGLAVGGERTAHGIAFRGREALRRFAARSASPVRSAHVVSQPLVELTAPDQGCAASYMRVYSQECGKAIALQAFGRYLDRFELTPSGWLFSHRICEV